MKNIELKKAIRTAIKYIDNYTIAIEIWQDTDSDGYFNQVTIIDNDNNDTEAIAFYNTVETITEAEKEAKKLYTYLTKHFKNVVITYVEI